MASHLTWTKQVEELVYKANKVLGLLKPTAGSKNKGIVSICQFVLDPRSTDLGIR